MSANSAANKVLPTEVISTLGSLQSNTGPFRPRLKLRRTVGAIFSAGCLMLTIGAIATLSILLARVYMDARPWISTHFLANFPSVMFPEKAGIKSALAGTIWLVILTAVISVPLGLGSAIYLEEYAKKGRFSRFIQLNIANLAGVPSIVYGILGLAIFIRFCHLGRSVLAGALTMSLLILPVIIIASREALAAVPSSIRLAAFGLGATRWQVIWYHVLPCALPGICTGIILALSRAVGEAAPLIMIGALTYVAFVPAGPLDEFTALPIQIYDWASRPQQEFHGLAAAAIVVLLAILISMNALAIGIRSWHQRRKSW